MIQVQLFQAILTLLGIIAAALVVVATFVKTSKEQRKQDIETWKSAVDALKEHNSALKQRLVDAEEEQSEQGKLVASLQGSLKTVERERISWTQRNMELFDLCQDLRAQVTKLGGDAGPPPNGDRGT